MADYFKDKAGSWDENPQVIESSLRFVRELETHFTFETEYSVLDFGCGTGLVGLAFADRVKSMVMVDRSPAMLSVLREKITSRELSNVTLLEGDLTEIDHCQSDIDLVFSLMALHHVENIPEVLNTFHGILKPKGTVIIGDLVQEDGSFHGGDHIEHHGFSTESLARQFVESNFDVVSTHVYNTIQKADNNGQPRDYDQFVLVAIKR